MVVWIVISVLAALCLLVAVFLLWVFTAPSDDTHGHDFDALVKKSDAEHWFPGPVDEWRPRRRDESRGVLGVAKAWGQRREMRAPDEERELPDSNIERDGRRG